MQKLAKRRLVVYLFVVGICALPAWSVAGDSFGFSGRDAALGGASSAMEATAAGATSNPAAMSFARAHFEFGYLGTQTALRQENVGGGSSNNYVAAVNLPIRKSLVFGLVAAMPTESFVTMKTVRKDEVFYLHDNQQRPEIYSAVAYKINEQVRVGAGLFYTIHAQGLADLVMTENDSDGRMMLELAPVVVPYYGLLIREPLAGGLSWLSAISYRDASSTKVNFDMDFVVDVGAGTLPLSITSQLVAFYNPAEFSFGQGLVVNDWSLYGTATLAYWSRYEAPVMELINREGGAGIVESRKVALPLNDSWRYRLGAEKRNLWSFKSGTVAGRFGLEYHTSALSSSSNTNLLDCNRTSVDVGVGIDFNNGEEQDKPVHFDIAAQLMSLAERDSEWANKQVKAGGQIFALTGGVSFDF